MSKILECKNVSKKIRKKQILKNVKLNVYSGDIVGFIGPNGAGKTTLIKMILGLQKISSGEIFINGYNIKNDFVKAIEKVGAIVENPDQYMYMSGMDNLKQVALLYNVKQEKIDEIVRLTKLEKRINDKILKYSLGMRQRLGIAVALLNEPNLLVLDEPTNGLDPEGIKDLRDILKRLSKSGVGVIISSHNLNELESFCNKVCIIKNGEIIENTKVDRLKVKDNSNYFIELNTIKGVKKIINAYGGEVIDNDIVKIYGNKDDISNFVKDMVIKNIKVYEVRKEALSLEEAFIQKTGGNIIE